MIAVPLLVVGITGLVLALWCRRGRSPTARWWVGMQDERPAYMTREPVALALFPYLGLVALLLGIVLLPGVRDSGALPLVLGALLVITGVFGWSTAYRTFLPMWIYPAWLRAQRRQDREELRERRRAQRP